MVALPYPWTQANALAAVLDDAKLWADALTRGHPEQRAQDLRKSVKYVLKQWQRGRIDVSDDISFGGAIVTMLRSEHGRHRFATAVPQQAASMFGRQLIAWLHADAHRTQVLSQFDGDFEHLRVALATAPINGDHWTIACFFAAKAMLDPAHAREYGELLLAADACFAQHVEPQHTRAAQEIERAEDTGEITPVQRAAEEPMEEDRLAADLIERLRRHGEWTSTASLSELEQTLELLYGITEQSRRAIADLHAAQARLQRQIDEIPDHPLLDHLGVEQGAALRRDLPLRDNLTVLDRRAAALANARQATDRIDELCQRLGDPPRWPPVASALQDLPLDERIATMTQVLVDQGDALHAELMRVEAEEATADALLSEWSLLDRPGSTAPDAPDRLAPVLRLLLRKRFRTERRAQLSAIHDDRPLVAALLTMLAVRDRPRARALFLEFAGGMQTEELAALLVPLDDETVHELAVDPTAPVELNEALFVLALESGRADLLELLAPHVRGDHAVADLVHMVRRETRSRDIAEITRRLAHFAVASTRSPDPEPGVRTRELRRKLLDRLTLPPGMSRLHQELRSRAQKFVNHRVRAAIDADQPDAALHAWTALGSLDDVVRACIVDLDSISARNVTDIHRKNTRSFLAEIEHDLRVWTDATRSAPPGDPLAQAVTRLAADGRARGEAGRSRSEAVLAALQRIGSGQRLQPLLVGAESVLADPGACVEPTHTVSFIAMCSGESVPVELYVADRLRAALGRGPTDRAAAVEALLRRQALHAARSAAADDSTLLARVDEAVAQRREALLREHEAVLVEARGIAPDSSEVSARLQLFDETLAAEDFENAEDLVRELADDLQRHRLLQDPERRQLLEFLRDAGESPALDRPIEQLRAQVEAHRASNAHLRIHLQFLLDLCDDPVIGEHVRPHFAPLVRRIDRPSAWPSERLAEVIAGSVDTVCKYLRTQAVYRADQPETVGQLLDTLPRHVADQLQVPCEGAADPLAALVDLIRSFHPPARVLQFVAPPLIPEVDATRPARPPRATVSVHRNADGDELAAHVRRYLARVVEQTAEQTPNTLGTIEDVLHAKDWSALRRFAAARVRMHGSAPQSRSDRISVLEALLAFACAREGLGDANATPDATLIYNLVATFWSKGDLQQFHLASELDLLLVEALDGRRNTPTGDLGTRVAELMATFSAVRRDDPAYAWATELMWAASQVNDREIPASARIAETLWDLLKQQHSPQPRANLLHWLYRLRNEEALRHLAAHSPSPSFALQCIHAFTRAESNPDVWPRALQMSTAFREQSARRKNRMPWVLLFIRLDRTSAHVDGEVAPIRIDALDRVVEDRGDGRFELSLLIEPLPSADPPEVLALRLFDERPIQLITDDEDLLSTRTLQTHLPVPPQICGGDRIEVPYVVAGRSFGGRNIDARGTLSLELAGEVRTPLTIEEIRHAWPGVSGNPVHHNDGFFGRGDEIREIDRRLRNDRGPGSLMLFGQRRVGKTSLLFEMVRLLPPRPGHVTGVFLDVSNLHLPDGTSMSERFFSAIVHSLNDPRNSVVRDALPVSERHFHRLFRGADASLSLYTALHSLLERLREESGGKISRLAFFVDEFDRFVEPLFLGLEKSVDSLMWDLRQIVMQSRVISLVLAGSGLQKMLTREYSKPLHGSIAQVEIQPFSWERDREAILNTFLPATIRGRLCRPENIEVVGRHATTMCGGHPYFLAMVGRAAGLSAGGRSINVPAVNDAARRLVSSNLPELPSRDGEVFFSHIFETLKRAKPRDQVLAKILLTHIASRTTEADRWLNLGDALDVPDLARISRESEREQVLRLLLDEGALSEDGRQSAVRLTVPITALALRHGAARLRHEAIAKLSAPTSEVP